MEEPIVLQAKPSIVPIILEWLVVVVIFITALPIFVSLLKPILILAYAYIAVTTIVVVVITVSTTLDLISREFYFVTLTESRVIKETGIFHSSLETVPLDRVQDVRVRYGTLAGRWLNYGSLVLETEGPEFKTKNLPNVGEWEEEILSRLGQVEGSYAPEEVEVAAQQV